MLSGTSKSDKAYIIRSSIPIVVYQFNPWDSANTHTNDASLLLPTNVMGKKYRIMNWDSSYHAADFSIVGIRNNTSVKVTSNGNTSTYNLSKFDVQNIELPSDTIGIYIESTEPVAVYAGNPCTFIPSSASCCCDHIEEQLFPTDTWGKTYYAAPSHQRGTAPDFWRIVSNEPNTTVQLPSNVGGTVVLKNAGDSKLIETTASFSISADKPISVGQFLASSLYNADHKGDPSFILSVPKEQYRDNYDFMVPSSFNENFITIIMPVNTVLTLDNATLNISGTKSITGTNDYVYYNYKIGPGIHHITGTSPFGLTGYGFYEDTSYGYPIGLDLKKINNTN
jgi:hypothetical protein